MGEACNIYEEEEKYIKGFGGKHERIRQLARPRHRWWNNIKVDHKGIGWVGVESIRIAQDMYKWLAVVNMVMNLLQVS